MCLTPKKRQKPRTIFLQFHPDLQEAVGSASSAQPAAASNAAEEEQQNSCLGTHTHPWGTIPGQSSGIPHFLLQSHSLEPTKEQHMDSDLKIHCISLFFPTLESHRLRINVLLCLYWIFFTEKKPEWPFLVTSRSWGFWAHEFPIPSQFSTKYHDFTSFPRDSSFMESQDSLRGKGP